MIRDSHACWLVNWLVRAVRVFAHAGCDADLSSTGRCPACGAAPGPDEIVMRPGPGRPRAPRDDRVSRALRGPHRLLAALR